MCVSCVVFYAVALPRQLCFAALRQLHDVQTLTASEVYPTYEVLGWYAVCPDGRPSDDDFAFHAQVRVAASPGDIKGQLCTPCLCSVCR
jgi:hypothetical protein